MRQRVWFYGEELSRGGKVEEAKGIMRTPIVQGFWGTGKAHAPEREKVETVLRCCCIGRLGGESCLVFVSVSS